MFFDFIKKSEKREEGRKCTEVTIKLYSLPLWVYSVSESTVNFILAQPTKKGNDLMKLLSTKSHRQQSAFRMKKLQYRGRAAFYG